MPGGWQTRFGTIEYTGKGQGVPGWSVMGCWAVTLMVSTAVVDNARAWLPYHRAVSFRVLRFVAAARATPAGQADAYALLLYDLGIGRAVVLGFSAGSGSVLEFGLRHPDRVIGQILANCRLGGGVTTSKVLAPALRLADSADRLFWIFKKLMARLLQDDGSPRGIGRRRKRRRRWPVFASCSSQSGPEGRCAYIDGFVSNLAADRFPSEQPGAPTLVLSARDDPPAPNCSPPRRLCASPGHGCDDRAGAATYSLGMALRCGRRSTRSLPRLGRARRPREGSAASRGGAGWPGQHGTVAPNDIPVPGRDWHLRLRRDGRDSASAGPAGGEHGRGLRSWVWVTPHGTLGCAGWFLSPATAFRVLGADRDRGRQGWTLGPFRFTSWRVGLVVAVIALIVSFLGRTAALHCEVVSVSVGCLLVGGLPYDLVVGVLRPATSSRPGHRQAEETGRGPTGQRVREPSHVRRFQRREPLQGLNSGGLSA